MRLRKEISMGFVFLGPHIICSSWFSALLARQGKAIIHVAVLAGVTSLFTVFAVSRLARVG